MKNVTTNKNWNKTWPNTNGQGKVTFNTFRFNFNNKWNKQID